MAKDSDKQNKNIILVVALLIVVGIGALFVLNSNGLLNQSEDQVEQENQMSGAPQADEASKETDTSTALEMRDLLYQLAGNLEDVTNGEDVRGINTGGEATGVAKANWDGNQYLMFATFENLPDPQGDDFYEGWVVQREPFMFISTGELEQVDGEWINAYRSDQDLTSYDFYVLTLEPNDGDPAPADHIVEGVME